MAKRLFQFLSLEEPSEANPHSLRLLLWASVATVLVLLVWAALSPIDQVTRATGVVIPDARSQVIQVADGGVIEELLVKEGDTVEAGAVLARLSRVQAEPAYLETLAKASALEANISRLRSELSGKSLPANQATPELSRLYVNQSALLQKRRISLNEEIQAFEQALALAQEELRMTEPLLARGDVSKTDVLRLQRQVADLSAQIVNRRNSYNRDVMAELSRNEEELMVVSQTLAQRKNLLDRTEVKSPSSGLVKNIRVTTLTGVLRAGEEFMQITPNQNDLLIEAKVKPSDIGFVKVGLPAAVKIDAFDYTVYGTLPGVISHVSSDSVRDESPKSEEFFRVQVRVAQKNLKEKLNGPVNIQAGMSAVVEIKTGTHSVLSYLTKPVTKTLSESLHER